MRAARPGADSITIQSVVNGGAAVRIAELSSRSGTSIPSIKYYLREGLLPAGTSTGRNQADYGPDAPVPPPADPSDDQCRRALGRRRPGGPGRGGHPRPADAHAARHAPMARSSARAGATRTTRPGRPRGPRSPRPPAGTAGTSTTRRPTWTTRPTRSLAYRDLGQEDLLGLMPTYLEAARTGGRRRGRRRRRPPRTGSAWSRAW